MIKIQSFWQGYSSYPCFLMKKKTQFYLEFMKLINWDCVLKSQCFLISAQICFCTNTHNLKRYCLSYFDLFFQFIGLALFVISILFTFFSFKVQTAFCKTWRDWKKFTTSCLPDCWADFTQLLSSNIFELNWGLTVPTVLTQ